MLNILSANYFIPDKFIDLKKESEFYGLSKHELQVFTRIYGLEKIPTAKEIGLKKLLSNSITKLFQNNNIDIKTIKYLIYSHTSKVITTFSESTIQFLKTHFKLDNAIIFATTVNNCASTISALEIASHLLKSDNPNDKALILTGELTFTEIQKVIPKVSILGDASAAMLVGNSGVHHKLLSLEIKVDGQSSEGVWMSSEKNKQFEQDYTSTLSSVITMALKKSNLNWSDIAFIFPHNVNLPSWHNVSKLLNFPIHKIYLKNIRKYSHCFGADIVINFVDADREKLIKPGDYYILVTVGLGSVYAAAVFKY